MPFLNDPRFPVDVNYGTMGGPTYSTDVVEYDQGEEYRNANWSMPRYMYDVRYAIKSRAQANNVYQFFLSLKGKLTGFRVKDTYDFTSHENGKGAVTPEDSNIGTADGVTYEYQLRKIYFKGDQYVFRKILCPVAGTVRVAVDSIELIEGVDFTVSNPGGLVTLAAVPLDGQVITAGFQFDVPVRFDKDDLSDIALVLYTTDGDDIVNLESIPLIELRRVV
jgi:uncharacterized protein (TIGR02217 family)